MAGVFILRKPGERDLPIHETESIMCDMNEGVYVSSVWHLTVGLTPLPQEVLGMLWRRREDDFWQHRYRLRTDLGTDDPFDHQDDKTVWMRTVDIVDEAEARAESEAWMRSLADRLRATEFERFDFSAWHDEAIEKFAKLPFAHMQTMPPKKHSRRQVH